MLNRYLNQRQKGVDDNNVARYHNQNQERGCNVPTKNSKPRKLQEISNTDTKTATTTKITIDYSDINSMVKTARALTAAQRERLSAQVGELVWYGKCNVSKKGRKRQATNNKRDDLAPVLTQKLNTWLPLLEEMKGDDSSVVCAIVLNPVVEHTKNGDVVKGVVLGYTTSYDGGLKLESNASSIVSI